MPEDKIYTTVRIEQEDLVKFKILSAQERLTAPKLFKRLVEIYERRQANN